MEHSLNEKRPDVLVLGRSEDDGVQFRFEGPLVEGEGGQVKAPITWSLSSEDEDRAGHLTVASSAVAELLLSRRPIVRWDRLQIALTAKCCGPDSPVPTDGEVTITAADLPR